MTIYTYRKEQEISEKPTLKNLNNKRVLFFTIFTVLFRLLFCLQIIRHKINI